MSRPTAFHPTDDTTATAAVASAERVIEGLTSAPAPGPGLGLDAGGTTTRWVVADAHGRLLARGEAPGFTALVLDTGAGRVALAQILQSLASDLRSGPARAALRLGGVDAGITGLGEPDGPAGQALRRLMADALGLAPAQIHCDSDIAAAWHALFRPGEGYLVYAGTGAIAAFIDTDGHLHRAGGRGPLLGDEGGGLWIAREALALVWRREDAQPGAWTSSCLARRLFDHIGGADWATSRSFVYGGDPAQRRGAIGQLALAVADAAHGGDPDAMALLHRAGEQLARLAAALVQRLGPRPVAVAGRVLQLHPAIESGMRSGLAAGPLFVPPHVLTLTVSQPDTALAAAIRAARRSDPGTAP